MKIKKISLFILTLVLIFVSIEVALRVIYFHKVSNHHLAISKYYPTFKRKLQHRFSSDKQFQINTNGIWEHLYNEKPPFLNFLKTTYRKQFQEFIKLTKKYNTPLCILYIPSTKPDSVKYASEKVCKNFFSKLAHNHKLPFIDMTQSLRAHPFNHVTLAPEDYHLSRFGNHIVTDVLKDYIISNYKTHDFRKSSYSGIPSLLGGYEKLSGKVYHHMKQKIQINKYGFRSRKSISIPKKSFRILCIGDSFTFGHGLADTHTYPYLLEQKLKHVEVLNLGMNGISISSQFAILKRAMQCSPDLIILQVLDNDLYGLMTHIQENFSILKPLKRPVEEIDYLKSLNKL